MKSGFNVYVTPQFERLARKLLKAHPRFRQLLAEAQVILESDPYNAARGHAIKKLNGVPAGEGQYRLRLGRFRFRYDLSGKEVWLVYCGLRREGTYS
jgi:mRNA-degrading endonuclease RelE of RelBE toxin-antitoxin system